MHEQSLNPLASAIVGAAAKLNAKKTPSNQKGLEGWFPYYAGYTERFAQEVIVAASRGKQLRVLDPWNGSGTTTRTAAMLGHQATGFDINPVATLVASAKLANPDDAAHVQGLAQRLATDSDEVVVVKGDPLLEWLGLAVVRKYRSIEQRILAELSTDESGRSLDPKTCTLPPLAAFLLLALMRASRRLASIKQGSNPTWLRPADVIVRARARTLELAWLEQIAEMARDLAAHSNLLSRAGSGAIHLGNSTDLPVPSSSFDLVVTSPPYCTRIDYAKGAAYELAALGISDGSECHRAIRADAMGTPLSRSKDRFEIPVHWPGSVQRCLGAIRAHPSKASPTYYYKTYFQYFTDCMASMSEIGRVLKNGGAGVLVVQSSYYKDVYVDLPQLYVDCARSLGLRAAVASTTAVRRTMAQINPSSRKHLPQKIYEESAVVVCH